MRISRIYTPQPLRPGQQAELDAQRSHYLCRVLRLQSGAPLVLFNGEGQEYPAELLRADRKRAIVLPGEPRDPGTESPLRSVLGLGISRGERMDYAIQKSTELGVSEFVPLFSEHCEVRLDAERLEKRLEHWRQIAISACEQCGRVRVPLLHQPANLRDWIGATGTELKLLFDHRQQEPLPRKRPEQGVALLIGPEGGLSDSEMEQARQAGFRGVALGSRILRTETAPVTALSVLQYLWG